MNEKKPSGGNETAAQNAASTGATGYIVTEMTNFMRIFRLPLQYPRGFCFGGGYPVEMQLVDWFNPFSPEDFWRKKEKHITENEMVKHRQLLRDFIKPKVYVTQFPAHKFLAIADYGDTFIITT